MHPQSFCLIELGLQSNMQTQLEFVEAAIRLSASSLCGLFVIHDQMCQSRVLNPGSFDQNVQRNCLKRTNSGTTPLFLVSFRCLTLSACFCADNPARTAIANLTLPSSDVEHCVHLQLNNVTKPSLLGGTNLLHFDHTATDRGPDTGHLLCTLPRKAILKRSRCW